MSDAKKIKEFIEKWRGVGKEQQHDQAYWIDFFQKVLGVDDATDKLDFQKQVDFIIDGKVVQKRLDIYIPDTKVIIEQKSLGVRLDSKCHDFGDGRGALTPFQQAKAYNDELPSTEKADWIVTSNFAEIWVYDMKKGNREREPEKFYLDELADNVDRFSFLIDSSVKELPNKQLAVSKRAGEVVGLLYDAFAEQYGEMTDEDTKSLNKLCVRLVFCLYAEDSGLFLKNQFHDYMKSFKTENMHIALRDLFRTLNTPDSKRGKFDAGKEFAYVNGGLFEGDVDIPPFNEKIRSLLLDEASMDFDWSAISPTIFGSIFESTLNPETRRAGGMHYTSLENLHKVIYPLFMDDLNNEFAEIMGREIRVAQDKSAQTRALNTFHKKLATLTFFEIIPQNLIQFNAA